jgi:D-alanyl-D-alanine carboxypeptidase, serine-type, PBP4 family
MYDAMKNFLFVLLLITSSELKSQPVSLKIRNAIDLFAQDTQLQHAVVSLYIKDESGKVVYEKNIQTGMAPASTEKIVTSATAFEILGSKFQYSTSFSSYSGNGDAQVLVVKGSGDPTLGSWRWKTTLEPEVMNRIANAIQQSDIKRIDSIIIDNTGWEYETIPGGWTWRDIGNYYGAGAASINWRENQFDIVLSSGPTINEPVKIVGFKPSIYNYSIDNYATSAEKGTGDNTYVYMPVNSSVGVIRGTIPINEARYAISASIPSSINQFVFSLADTLNKKGIIASNAYRVIDKWHPYIFNGQLRSIHTETSPTLDSMVYWFLKKSINLYGEALLKTVAYNKTDTASTEKGIEVVQNTWKDKGIEKYELNLLDGSGLSPENRITTHAEVTVLSYAKSQPWFAAYLNAFPEYNGMKMKSGTISHVKGFTGYHTSKDGHQYMFSFLVNGYNGSESILVKKMYKVLDNLK